MRSFSVCALALFAVSAPVSAQSPSDFFQSLQEFSGQTGSGSGPTSAPPTGVSPFASAAQNGGTNEPVYGLPLEQQLPQAPAQLSQEEIEAQIRGEAFDAATNSMLPMRPEEIRKLLMLFDETRQATETPVFPYPKPTVAVETVPLDPGATPPTVKVATGHVATINILDITGAPWPIQDVTWAGNFEVVKPEEGGQVLRVTPLSEFAYGNMSVRLVELETPIIFSIRTTRDIVHYRFDARIPEYGPFASAPIIDGGLTIAAGSAVLGSILDGVPPEDAERLTVDGVDGRTSAYQVNTTTYLRTPLTLLSPGWSGSVSSADGMKVYEISNAPVVLLSDGGQVVRARLGVEEETE